MATNEKKMATKPLAPMGVRREAKESGAVVGLLTERRPEGVMIVVVTRTRI